MPGPIWSRLFLTPLLLASLTACSPLRTIDRLTPDNTYRLSAGIAYGPLARQKLDIYAPLGATRPTPVVVFFYGGNWDSGARGEYRFVGEALAARGITAVIADYRLYPQVVYPAFVEDSARAVAWTLAHIGSYGGDPHRLFVMGHSAGAYNAAMVALDPRWLASYGDSPGMLSGWIGLAGPYNFLPIDVDEIKPIFLFPHTPLASQPINHVAANAPPALLLTGSADTIVSPVRNSGALASALRAAHDAVQTENYRGVTHALLIGSFAKPLRWVAPALAQVVAFVKDTAPAARPTPNHVAQILPRGAS
ncbi:alpha/beta hydrolase [Pandoraea sp.]|uniref:alpha/beta hydrolase n=1 Tax=Pandoraea sp. TaxID=1883445 RepID=UPI001218AF95|nr:alpha/beta hydrolase [Pandoraea sp.]TAL54903.1 MAG: alpha/beta hydrolase [Pandoraea sp.]TAM18328.1 MAG: alpha/beta hydrolase [Pandoraea sp.]